MSDNPASTPDPSGVQRTETGEIKSQTQTTTPAATTPQTTTQAEGATPDKPSILNQDGRSVANQPVGGAPETYADYTVPDGYTLDKEVATEANGLFKGMNLNQEQAQQLVDFYTKHTSESANAPYQAWHNMQEQWVNEVKADPVLGPRLNEVKTTIGKAIDGLGDARLAKEFRDAMDFTGAGNNPAFIRAFYRLAQKVTEGGHVAGNGPSAASQKQDQQRMSAAGAMYPNLPRA
jgi:hypothetical protein